MWFTEWGGSRWRVQQIARAADRPQNWAQYWRKPQAYSAVGQWTSKCRQGEIDWRHERLNHTVLEYTSDTDQLKFNHIWWLAQTKLSVCLCDPQLSKKHSWMKERIDQEEEDDAKQDKDQSEVVQKRITEWAKEIQSVSEVGQQKYLCYLGWWCLICCY